MSDKQTAGFPAVDQEPQENGAELEISRQGWDGPIVAVEYTEAGNFAGITLKAADELSAVRKFNSGLRSALRSKINSQVIDPLFEDEEGNEREPSKKEVAAAQDAAQEIAAGFVYEAQRASKGSKVPTIDPAQLGELSEQGLEYLRQQEEAGAIRLVS